MSKRCGTLSETPQAWSNEKDRIHNLQCWGPILHARRGTHMPSWDFPHSCNQLLLHCLPLGDTPLGQAATNPCGIASGAVQDHTEHLTRGWTGSAQVQPAYTYPHSLAHTSIYCSVDPPPMLVERSIVNLHVLTGSNVSFGK